MLLIHGVLYSWGANERGQLGRAEPQWDATGRACWSVPAPVAALDDAGEAVVQASCGAHHTAALCSPSGKLYLWGEGKSVPGNASPLPALVVRTRSQGPLAGEPPPPEPFPPWS